MTGVTVELRFDEAGSEQRFLTLYLPDAWDRYERSEYWEQGWYWPYGQFETYEVGVEGGLVRLVFDGDPDGLLAAERDQWAAFDGLREWSVERYDQVGLDSLLAQQREAKGDLGGRREYRYKPLTARLALAIQEAFEGDLPAAPDPGDDDPAGIGMWSLVHSLYVQCGYDWYAENDASLRAMESRVRSIGSYRGAKAAREEYDRLLEGWRAFESDLTSWLAEHGTGEASI